MPTYQRGKYWWYRFRFAGERIDEPTKSTSRTVARRGRTATPASARSWLQRLQSGLHPELAVPLFRFGSLEVHLSPVVLYRHSILLSFSRGGLLLLNSGWRFLRTIRRNIAPQENPSRLPNRSVALRLKSLQYPKTRKCKASLSVFVSAVVLLWPYAEVEHPANRQAIGEWAVPAVLPVEYKRPNSLVDFSFHETSQTFPVNHATCSKLTNTGSRAVKSSQ
jgi:hypothetical protein